MMHGPQRPVHTPYLQSAYMWKKDRKIRRTSAPRSPYYYMPALKHDSNDNPASPATITTISSHHSTPSPSPAIMPDDTNNYLFDESLLSDMAAANAAKMPTSFPMIYQNVDVYNYYDNFKVEDDPGLSPRRTTTNTPATPDIVPKIGRTLSDAVQDELYNPDLYANVPVYNSRSTSPYYLDVEYPKVDIPTTQPPVTTQVEPTTTYKTISPHDALLEPEADVINFFVPERRSSAQTTSNSSRYGSVSEYYPPPVAPRHYSMDSTIERPANTRADTGAYTCTIPGCGNRFPTAGKLQKHRRESHRKSPTLGNVTSAAAIASRNAQPGPHRCMRTNPATGRPCNTVFSRPYDLTRHEDTIHNKRKVKVRCEMCVEEKTFSRPDALVRHRRVKHGIH